MCWNIGAEFVSGTTHQVSLCTGKVIAGVLEARRYSPTASPKKGKLRFVPVPSPGTMEAGLPTQGKNCFQQFVFGNRWLPLSYEFSGSRFTIAPLAL